jgi:hypothetical protein
MLERQVSRRRVRVHIVATTAFAAGVAFAVFAWVTSASRAPDAVVVPISLPPPTVVPAPPAAAVVATDDPAPAPAPVAPTCPKDVSSIGVPFDQADQIGNPDNEFFYPAAASGGCTLVLWASAATSTIHVSWDAGQTFSTIAIDSAIDQLAVADGRIAVLRKDGALGTLTATKGLIWRALPTITPTRLLAAGPYTVVIQAEWSGTVGHDPRLPLKIAYSSDDGQQWSFLTPPVESVSNFALDAKGILTVAETTYGAPDVESGCGPSTVGSKSYDTRLDVPRWTTTPTPAWSYQVDDEHTCDHFSRSFVVAIHDGHRETISGMHRDEAEGSTWVMGPYASWAGTLYRLRGLTVEAVGTVPLFSMGPVVIDRYGTLIASYGRAAALMRWSPRGGWRVLFPTPGH